MMIEHNQDNDTNNIDNHSQGGENMLDKDLDKKIDDTLASLTIPTKSNKEEIWNAISSRIDFDEKQESKVSEFPKSKGSYPAIVWKSVAVAASIILVAGLSIYFIGNKDIYNAKGSYTTVTLPDGSTSQLMPNSRLRYNSIMFAIQRDVKLYGEAFFKVAKGSQFSVTNKVGQSVIVLGTQFQVYTRHNTFEVFCNEGSVGVLNKGQEIAKLTPNHGINVVNETDIKTFESITYTNDIANKFKGVHKYENARLERVFDDFSNAYGVEVDFEAKNKIYTGQFTTVNIEKALTYICEPYGLKYEIKGNTVVIR